MKSWKSYTQDLLNRGSILIYPKKQKYFDQKVKQTYSTIRLDFHQNSSTFSNRKYAKIATAGKFTRLPDIGEAHGPASTGAGWRRAVVVPRYFNLKFSTQI